MQGNELLLFSTKGVIAVFSAMWAFFWESVTPLFFVLIALMFIDYFTGLGAGALAGNLQSGKGFKGVIKKFSYVVLVFVCILADYTIKYLGAAGGIVISFRGIFTLIIICWLIGVELLSIIENLGRLGAPIPNFLKKAFKQFKDAAEKQAESIVDAGGSSD